MTYSQQKKYNNMQEILLTGCHLFREYLKKKTSVYTLKPWQETGGVLSRNYLLGEKSWIAQGATSFLGGSRGMPPPPPKKNVLKWICTEMQSGAFWDTILRNVTVSGWFFQLYSYLYTVMTTMFFGGSFYPSNTLDRTLTDKCLWKV